MFPDREEELWEEDDSYDMYLDGLSDEDLENELKFLKKLNKLKEIGKFVYIFEQKYVF